MNKLTGDNIMELKIDEIQLDKELTPRSGLNKAAVISYESSFDELPLVDVFWIEGREGLWLADGFHRYEAAKNIGRKVIKVKKHQGTFDDAKEFSFDANLKHGQPLTLEERKEAVKLKLIRYTERSDNWIGEDCGIDNKTVRVLREALEKDLGIPKCSMFFTKDGRKYPRKQEKKEDKQEIKKPITVYHGDMLEFLPKLGKFDLVVTDAPYGVTGWSWDELNKSEYLINCKKWLKAIKSVLKDKYHFFWFCSPKYQAVIEKLFDELELAIQSRIVWIRRNMAMGSKSKTKFVDTWEMILHSGNKQLNFDTEWSEKWFDTQIYAVPQTNYEDKKLHPTQKPLSLIRLLVEVGSNKNSRVLDPFAGAGTTGEACKKDDRECVLIELDSGHVTTIQNRLDIQRSKLKK